ncbi:MAG: minor capsid protein, partial [Bacteroidetes bacterium]|nr:minor capsid protein [Bacteroidota bacterium]
MSKRILGGSGITDEKSFVGSAEIQFRMAKDRYDSDRLLLKNVINQQLFPRLAKLSPVYLPLANHYFEWQEEPEDPHYLKDLVTGLAPHFDLDIEELSQRLGVTILSQKRNATLPEPEQDVKALFDELTVFYESHHDCGHEPDVEVTALDFSKWDALIDRIAKDLHEGKLKPEDLDSDAINATYSELNQAGRKGYGKDWNSFPGDGKGELPNELKKNLYMFSGAKTYSMLEQLNGFLYDQSGRLLPYNEFEVLARKLNRQYNRNWLQAEWQTARTAAQMAQKWERLQETKDLFPNLEFRTVGDDRVRDAHRELHGIIKPIDDEFWSKYYPPLDWRCRCDAVPTAADPKGEVPENMREPNFKGNIGKDKEIFTQKHNFFKLLNKDENAKRNMELMKLNAPHIKHSKNKKVEVSIFADKKDLSQNLESAIKIADNLNIKVQIRPHLDTNIA